MLIIEIYVMVILATVIHEIAHYIVARKQFGNVKRIVIGNERFAVRIGKVVISPIVYSGSVEIDYQIIYRASMKEIIFFFLSGASMNLLLSITAFILFVGLQRSVLFLWGIINGAFFLANVIPGLNNDMETLVLCLKRR